jgi:hypothetical protein
MDVPNQTHEDFSYVRTNQLLTHAKKTLCEAILKMLISGSHTKQWDQRKLVFDNEKTRYLHRFKSFVSLISPPHPPFELFKKTIDIQDFDLDRMKEVIKNDLSEAKKMLENLLTLSAAETYTDMCREKFTEVIRSTFSILHCG